MRSTGFFTVLAIGCLSATLALGGCNQADRQPGETEELQSSGTARVREEAREAASNPAHMAEQMQQCQRRMEQHLGTADAEYDRRFIDMMIPHHQGAVQMAEDALEKSQHPEIRKMAQSIIDSQQKEIQQLQTWRQQWYGSSQAARQE